MPHGDHGKTTFIRLWQQFLREYIHINAWESDFSDEPLLTLVSALDDWIRSNENTPKIKNATNKIQKLLPPIMGAIAKATTFGLLDITNEIENVAAGLAGDLTNRTTQGIIGSFNIQKHAIECFKEALSEIIDSLPETQKNLVIFIDELDRCRPLYAINLLERIKHIFDIEGVTFVLSMNQHQLFRSIKAIYGSNFDGGHYLKRFIDFEYRLKKPSIENYINSLYSPDYESSFFSKKDITREMDLSQKTISILSKRYDYSLRDLNQIVARLRLILRSISNNHYLDASILCIMLFPWQSRKDIYQKLCNDDISSKDLAFELLNGDPEVVEIPNKFGWAFGFLVAARNGSKDYSETIKYFESIREKKKNNLEKCYEIDEFLYVANDSSSRSRGTAIKLAQSRIELLKRIEI